MFQVLLVGLLQTHNHVSELQTQVLVLPLCQEPYFFQQRLEVVVVLMALMPKSLQLSYAVFELLVFGLYGVALLSPYCEFVGSCLLKVNRAWFRIVQGVLNLGESEFGESWVLGLHCCVGLPDFTFGDVSGSRGLRFLAICFFVG